MVHSIPAISREQAVAYRLGVDGIGERDVTHALEDDKTLLQAFGARAAPHVSATADAPTYLIHGEAGRLAAFRERALGTVTGL